MSPCPNPPDKCLILLWLKPHFPLVSNGQNADLVARYHKTIQSNVSRVAVRNDQFAQFPLNPTPDQRVRREAVDRRLDRRNRAQRCIWILVAQKLKGALDMLKRPRRIDYRCHGFGRAARSSRASRCIQAWTSSAR